MGLTPTQESLDLLRNISETVSTWHHCHHFLLDIANQNYPAEQEVVYLEIGCYDGASSCLMLQRPNTKVIAIDTGIIPFKRVRDNVERFNKHDNDWYYIHVDSHDRRAREYLASVTDRIDILFIDGGHEAKDVIADFLIYSAIVSPGGWIVFDDYRHRDYVGVKQAVDSLREKFPDYESYGLIENHLGARSDGTTQGNCFVMRKANG